MLEKKLYRLNMIHKMIANKNTGTPLELSKKLQISERQVHNYIGVLKRAGGPIDFSSKIKSYYYTEDGFFSFNFIKAVD